ncbi:hypothetical protein [Helicobacter sp.]|nr:hypothetical protein [Helicobacter sp.]
MQTIDTHSHKSCKQNFRIYIFYNCGIEANMPFNMIDFYFYEI